MGGGMGFGFGGLSMLLFWAVIIAAIVFGVKWMRNGASRTDSRSGKSARDILQERYARGEIGKDEFEQKKRDLG